MSTGIPGLTCRNGIYHVDKMIKGERVRRSLETRSFGEARVNLELIAAQRTCLVVESDWTRHVGVAIQDSQSWLRRLVASVRRRGELTGLGCSIGLAEIRAIALRSRGLCEVTGIAFDLGGGRGPFVPSLDRIDSAQGYHAGNCRLVFYAVNLAMARWGLQPLQVIARALVARELTASVSNPRRNSAGNGQSTDRDVSD